MIEPILRNSLALGGKTAIFYRNLLNGRIESVPYNRLIWSTEEFKLNLTADQPRRYAVDTANRVEFIRTILSLWSLNDYSASVIPIG